MLIIQIPLRGAPGFACGFHSVFFVAFRGSDASPMGPRIHHVVSKGTVQTGFHKAQRDFFHLLVFYVTSWEYHSFDSLIVP